MNAQVATTDQMVDVQPSISEYLRRREEILDRVRRMLIASLDLRREPEHIDPDTVLFGSGLGLDSVDNVEILVSLEMDFGVKLGDAEARRRALRSVNAIVDAVLTAQTEGTV